ncbi:ACP S-malonyltransferase [Streptomyces sp. cmx-4-9]|uniref:ACP S-malonyltransferase n=1 Tax=Streptomyces sp. cmx-4-9 TaxID=2790941 RepID=UPI0039818E9D
MCATSTHPEVRGEHIAVGFPGQGSQGPCMGVPWYGHRAWNLVEYAEQHLGRPLVPMLLDPAVPPNGATETQLAVVMVSMMAWSQLEQEVAPRVLAGHSLGLIPALFAAGVLTAKEAVTVASLRALVTEEACRRHPGGMAAVLMPVADAEAACAEHECWVANDNAPQQAVISGTRTGLRASMAAARRFGAADVIQLDIAGAFHSPLMKEASARFQELLQEIDFAPTRAVIVHNAVAHPPGSATDWRAVVAADLVTPVRWRETQLLLARRGLTTFIEAGYGRTLTGIAKRTLDQVRLVNASSPQAITELARTLGRPAPLVRQ